jgi:hypothetical protein
MFFVSSWLIFISFRGGAHRDMNDTSEQGGANWPLCLAFQKDRIEWVKAKRPVCPTLAPRFSSFRGVAARHEGSCGKLL